MRLHPLSSICTIKTYVADEGMPAWADLVGRVVAPDVAEFAGGGVYACFWDDRLIYIGSFTGPQGDPFGGNVSERIYKHVIGFTLRAKALGFSPRPLRSIIDNLDHEIARDLAAARCKSTRLERGAIKATFNKARFAKLHWPILSIADPDTLLARFSFGYRRLDPQEHVGATKRTVKYSLVKPIERELIRQFQPICNTEFRTDVDGPDAGPGLVTTAFDRFFSSPLPPVAERAGDPDDETKAEELFPTDPRWEEYSIKTGEARVRATKREGENGGHVLLFRQSRKTIVCLAGPDALARRGVQARSAERGPLRSAVDVDFAADASKREALLRTILEASLAELPE